MLSDKDAEAGFLEEKTLLQKIWTGRLKRCLRRYAALEEEESRARGWKEEEHLAQLLQTYFFRLKKGLSEIELEDWEQEGALRKIPLDPRLDPAEQVKRRFKKSRKLKRRLELSEELRAAQAERIRILESALAQLQQADTLEKLKPFKKAPSSGPKKREPFRVFTTARGTKIYVGKKDRDNDRLTFDFARGNDFWFHVADFPGSHVILREEEPDEESLLDAMQLALHYSKAPGEAEVVVTQRKYVSKVKGGKAGLVHLSKHKKRFCAPDPIRMKRLTSTEFKIKE
jgi:predicted ribosome quality control (RQC) complex YloA/Tae2 family protein